MNTLMDSIQHWSYDRKPKPYSEVPGQYMVIDHIAQTYKEHKPSGNEIEEAYRVKFVFEHPNYEVEIYTPIGRIDCLSDINLVEIKSSEKWKEGLGQ